LTKSLASRVHCRKRAEKHSSKNKLEIH